MKQTVHRAYNFNAGPAALPLAVLEKAQQELLDFRGSGMSVMEVSHRGKAFIRVAEEAEADLRELLSIPSDYKVLFLSGGATGQFAAVPMNLATWGSTVDYVNTGSWSKKALEEARTFCSRVHVVADSKDSNYSSVPPQSEWNCSPDAAYLHYTPNETIGGVEFPFVPDTGDVPLVADLSSTILSRPLDVTRFGLIYAGAQKNIGPSGVTIVIAKKSLIAECREDIPKIFRFKEHARENSLLNTAPTFAIYMVRNVLAVVKEEGGLAAMEQRNREKARLVYDLIDENPDFFRSKVEKASRSVMNPVFRLPTEDLDKKMVADAAAAGFVGIKGHKLVGGIRISQYNATTVEQVAKFADWARGFAKAHG